MSSKLYTMTDIAVKLKATTAQVNLKLKKLGFHRKVNKKWILFDKYKVMGIQVEVLVPRKFHTNGKDLYNTYFNEKGVYVINELMAIGVKS